MPYLPANDRVRDGVATQNKQYVGGRQWIRPVRPSRASGVRQSVRPSPTEPISADGGGCMGRAGTAARGPTARAHRRDRRELG